jgi:hypothetical protein
MNSASGIVSGVTVEPDKRILSVTLDNDKRDFVIPVDKFVELDSFKDLKGRETMMGGLLLLTPVHQKLDGKNVTIKYIPLKNQYLITALRVEGLTPSAGRRFSGQVKLYNGMSEPVRKLTIQGFAAEFNETDINPNSTVLVLLRDTVEVPRTIRIIWESTTGQKTQEIDLSVLQQTQKDGGTLSFSLTPQGVWTLEKDQL